MSALAVRLTGLFDRLKKLKLGFPDWTRRVLARKSKVRLSVRLAGWFQVIERAAGPTGTSFSLQEKALSGSLENPCLTESQLRLGSKYGDRSLGARSL